MRIPQESRRENFENDSGKEEVKDRRRCELNLARSDAFWRRLEGGARAMGEASASDDHTRRGTRRSGGPWT